MVNSNQVNAQLWQINPQGPSNVYIPVPVPPFYQPLPPAYQYPTVVLSTPYIQQHSNVLSCRGGTVPPPTAAPRFTLRSPNAEISSGKQKYVKKKASHAIPIIDPKTNKDITKQLQTDLNNNNNNDIDENNNLACCSQLRRSAPDFVPSAKCTSCAVDSDCSNNNSSNTNSNGTAEENVEGECEVFDIGLNETMDSSTGFEEELSLLTENDDNPSITASIRKIPSNLEQQLNQQQLEELNVGHSNFKIDYLPSNPNSHTSLPDFHHSQVGHHHYQGIHNSPPHLRQSHHPHHESFQNRHRSNSNHRNFGSRRYNKHTTASKSFHIHDSNYDHNNNSKKHHVEVTANFIKDVVQNNSNNSTSEADETKDLKDISIDMNNNEAKAESTKITEGSLMESTNENSGCSSLNSSIRYSTEELTVLKKSPLVLTKPPTVNDNLLNSKLNGFVWRTLFEKTTKSDDLDFIVSHNSSNGNKNISGKRSCNNLRYDNNNNNMCNNNNKGNNNSHGPLMRSRSGSDKEIIKINLSDVKLNEAENAWVPTHLTKGRRNLNHAEQELESLRKNFRSLLNKLTEENFEHLLGEINDKRKFNINTNEKLSAIVELLFEKSIAEPGYASTYAKLCKILSTVHVFEVENPQIKEKKTKTNNPWKLCLITRCQSEFERTQTDHERFKTIQKQIQEASDAEEIENLEEIYLQIRQRANGTVKFIGELYKINMLTAKIMRSCIRCLIDSVTEENIERVCKLLTTVGEKLEGDMKKSDMDAFMKELEKLKNSKVITTQRIKFDIMNVMDLRLSNWKPRENSRTAETKPQKLQELQEEEEKRKRKQQMQLNDYNERQHNMHNNNKINHHRSFPQNNGRNIKAQRMFDSEGFRLPSRSNFDFDKVKIPSKNTGSEMTLGPPAHLFQNFNRQPIGKMVPPPTTINNPYGNLSTDCDDPEDLTYANLTRSGSTGSNGKSGRRDHNNNSSRNNANHKQQQQPAKAAPAKARTPSPESIPEMTDDDEFFMIDLTEREEKDMSAFNEKLQQTFKGKITLDMLSVDLQKIKITENVLGCVYNDLFDKKTVERMEWLSIIAGMLKKGLISSKVNIEALKLSLKSIPSIICDVPHANDYFADYCIHFVNSDVLSLKDAEQIVQNHEKILKTLKEKANVVNGKVREAEKTANVKDDSKTIPMQAPVGKIKVERSLKNLMETLQFKLCKKQKQNFLDEIYGLIDKENCADVLNFIRDLTYTILRACYGKPKKHGHNSKKADLSKLYPIFIRYINDDFLSQIECIDAILEFVSNNPNKGGCTLEHLFGLFYDNDVISIEAFKAWKEKDPTSQKKLDAIKQTTSFYVKLEEPDLSDEDFNCTSSTIKD